jgi:hypothetical protein
VKTTVYQGFVMDADEDRYTAAIALAPFLAEHYYATGRDLVDVAALDQAIMGLAAAYARLPALAQQTSEAAAASQRRWQRADGCCAGRPTNC